jgi:hypothetical protein
MNVRLKSKFEKFTATPSIIAAILSLPFLVFLHGYVLMSRFGIYEDDYFYILPTMSFTSLAEFLGYLWSMPTVVPLQGRPLGFFLNEIVSFIFDRSGHIETSYLAGWLIVSLNAVLIFLILRNCMGAAAGFMSAVFYIVFPADTSRMILMHRVFANLTLTFVLVSLALYQRQRTGSVILSYIIAGASVLVYESFYLLFGLAPVLVRGPIQWRRLIIHLLTIGLILAPVLLVRMISGESRSLQLVGGFQENLPKIVEAMCFGATTALVAYPLRAIDSLLHSNACQWLAILIAFAAIAIVLLTLKSGFAPPERPEENLNTTRWFILFSAGLFATMVAYVLAFRAPYFPPITVIGRLSGVHCAAAFGGAMIVGLLFERLLSVSRMSAPAILVSAFFPALIFGFGLEIQNEEYANGWDREKEFWNGVATEAGDIEEGGVILVDLRGYHAPIGLNSLWASLSADYSLPRLVRLPESWKIMPKLFGFLDWMPHHEEGNAIILESDFLPSQVWPRIEDGQFILLGFQDGVLRRITDKSLVLGKELTPKPATATKPLTLTPVGEKLLRPHQENQWFTLSGKTPFPEVPIWDFRSTSEYGL